LEECSPNGTDSRHAERKPLNHARQTLLNTAATTTRMPRAIKNPQPSAICEQMYPAAANILQRTSLGPPTIYFLAALFFEQIAVDNALVATALNATHTAAACSLNMTPGEVVFHHDMLVTVPIVADLATFREQPQQALVDKCPSYNCQNTMILTMLVHNNNLMSRLTMPTNYS
jgi:hypothetical protein